MGWRPLTALLCSVLLGTAVRADFIVTPSDINTCSNSCKCAGLLLMFVTSIETDRLLSGIPANSSSIVFLLGYSTHYENLLFI